MRNNGTNFLTRLRLITVPVQGPLEGAPHTGNATPEAFGARQPGASSPGWTTAAPGDLPRAEARLPSGRADKAASTTRAEAPDHRAISAVFRILGACHTGRWTQAEKGNRHDTAQPMLNAPLLDLLSVDWLRQSAF